MPAHNWEHNLCNKAVILLLYDVNICILYKNIKRCNLKARNQYVLIKIYWKILLDIHVPRLVTLQENAVLCQVHYAASGGHQDFSHCEVAVR